MSDKILDAMLQTDALGVAERITGKDYKTSTLTSGLGLAIQMELSGAKKAYLESIGDTTYSSSYAYYTEILTKFGFERVYREGFVGNGYSDREPPLELHEVWARRDGLLLDFDTYNTNSINSAKIWYNWKPNDPSAPRFDVTSSGGFYDPKYPHVSDEPKGLFRKDNHKRTWKGRRFRDAQYKRMVWCGDHDAREALVHKITKLEERGSFVPVWSKRPFLWLLHYMDTKEEGYDYNALNAARIAAMPEWVQEMIGPKDD